MKTILTAAAIAALGVSSALVSSASAADMAVRAPMYAKAPMVAPFSWAGFYVGANIGVDWASNKVTLAPDPIGFGIPNTLLLIQQGTTTLQGSSVIGGLQAGYNYMLSSNILLGLEGDVDALRARNSRTVLFTCPNLSQVGCGFQQDFSKTFFATLRPRLGVTMYRGMVYATGGLAVASWKTSDVLTTYGGPSAITAASTSQTAAGWTLGAGLEYALTDNWLLGLVYLYADLGKSSSTAPAVFGACCSEIGYTHRLTENLVRINLNYKFGNYAYAVPVRK